MQSVFFFSFFLFDVHYSFFLSYSWERTSISLLMLSAKQGNYWYHFITSLVWRGPWLGIEPGTSRTQSQHSTTRLSRRRWAVHANEVTNSFLRIFADRYINSIFELKPANYYQTKTSTVYLMINEVLGEVLGALLYPWSKIYN